MKTLYTWIGGASLLAVLGLGAVAVSSGAFAENEGASTPLTQADTAAEFAPHGAILAKLQADAARPFTIKRILPIDGPIKIFRDGYEIGAAAVMLGTDEHPTPTGTFPILSKERHNVSEKYGNAPMPWTLRLTWDGIAIHGGSDVENGYASHGCVAIPDELAAKVFDIARKGDKVVITDGRRIGMGDSIIG
ncbi:MAG: L,D-transpeptidase [Citromicrobium sp.]|nr:MAG: L,D-transpeptidase [Citromicrobium sp.]